jgi:hypothetical protein
MAIAAPTAFASDYCISDIALDAHKAFIPQHKSESLSNEPLAKNLPSFSATAKLDRKQLSFVNAAGQTYPVAKLNSGDDYNGWDAIHELEDHWLYVVGAQYNHAVHLRLNEAQQWEADQIIRMREDEGILEYLARLFLDMDAEEMKRDNLSSIIKVRGHGVYSEALQRLLFPAMMQEFKNGDLVTFGQANAETYVGDVPRLKIALFKANDGQLYSYDGLQLEPVENGKVEPYFVGGERLEKGLLHDVPTLDKSFYAVRAGAFELVEHPDHYELKKIPLPSSVKDFFFTHFIPTPDGKDVAILTRENIFLLSSLRGIYPRSGPQLINTTGSDELPALIPELQGIMFTTGGRHVAGDKTEYYHLLKNCSE